MAVLCLLQRPDHKTAGAPCPEPHPPASMEGPRVGGFPGQARGHPTGMATVSRAWPPKRFAQYPLQRAGGGKSAPIKPHSALHHPKAGGAGGAAHQELWRRLGFPSAPSSHHSSRSCWTQTDASAPNLVWDKLRKYR